MSMSFEGSLYILDLKLRVHIKKTISYFSTKTYVVGTQKNHLNETVLLSTQLMGMKIFHILRSKILFILTYVYSRWGNSYK